MFLLFVFIAVSCQKKVVEIENIAGYWEIEKVLAPGKEKKEYKINESFDHFSISGNSGMRSKVQPQFDGTFLVNDQPESFTVELEDGDTYLHYATPFAKWKERIISIEDSVLVIRNMQEIEFYYKRTGPINFTGDGKKTE